MITDQDIARLLEIAQLEEAIRQATFLPGGRVEISDAEDDESVVAVGVVVETNWTKGKSIILWADWGNARTVESIYSNKIRPLQRRNV